MIALRSDYLVALNEAIASLEEAANLYRAAAEEIAEADRTAGFSARSRRRSAMAAVLRAMVQDRDDIPTSRPAEQLLLQGVLAQLKTLWADDEIEAFANDIAARESHALQCLAGAAARADDGASSKRLADFGAEIEADLAHLKA